MVGASSPGAGTDDGTLTTTELNAEIDAVEDQKRNLELMRLEHY